jgi:hypothetical protein
MLVHLLKTFPEMKNRDEIIAKLDKNFTAENMQAEADYYKRVLRGQLSGIRKWLAIGKLVN